MKLRALYQARSLNRFQIINEIFYIGYAVVSKLIPKRESRTSIPFCSLSVIEFLLYRCVLLVYVPVGFFSLC